jgi:hypothetical protein
MGFKKYFNLNYNKGPDHGATMATVEEALKYWNFEEPKEMVRKLMYSVGPPAEMSIMYAKWGYVGGFDNVCIVDEEVPHNMPTPHKDFLYCCKKIGVSPALYTPLAEVSGSILIDGTKGVVKARCASLLANAITLGFVEDVVAGNVEPTIEEYERRMEENQVPNWFQDSLGEMMSEGTKVNEERADVTVEVELDGKTYPKRVPIGKGGKYNISMKEWKGMDFTEKTKHVRAHFNKMGYKKIGNVRFM